MAARTKVDLSDDPMASLFEDDFVPASKTAPAPAAHAAEEPELRALDFSKVAIKGAAAPPKPAPTAAAPPSDHVVREDLHGDDVRMGLGVDFSSLAPAVGADLDVMRRDALKMRGAGPTVVKHGDGLDAIIGEIFAAQRRALAAAAE